MLGGASHIGPGQSIEAPWTCPPGWCWPCATSPTPGVAHALMGMTTTLTVEEAADAPADAPGCGAAEPVVGTIEMAAEGYRSPTSCRPAGTTW